jgi:hypothetical protein
MGRRQYVITAIVILGITLIAWGYYLGMSIMSLLVIGTSLAYQIGALPWEIRRNRINHAVTKVSYSIAFVGAASYTVSTMRAIMQPDWTDVASRWWGMVGSLIIVLQIVAYDRIRLTRRAPFLVATKMYPEKGHSATARCDVCAHKTWPRQKQLDSCPCGGNFHIIGVILPLIPPRRLRQEEQLISRCSKCGERRTEGFDIASLEDKKDKKLFWLMRGDGKWKPVTPEAYAEAFSSTRNPTNSFDATTPGVYFANLEPRVFGIITKANGSPHGFDPIQDPLPFNIMAEM